MKARKVKGLDPAEPLADNAERIVRVRLDEMCGFMPQAADPSEVVALHDMRIAAKRLRYILEITGADLRRLRGDGRAADQGPPGPARRDPRLRRPDPGGAGVPRRARGRGRRGARRGGGRRRGPRPVGRAPGRRTATTTPAWWRCSSTCARVASCSTRRFLELWQEYERKGYRARLEYAVSERAAASGDGALTSPAAEPG